MNKLVKFLVGIVVVAGIIVGPLVNTAEAASKPRLEVEQISHNRFRITVSNAPSYSSVDIYSHQSDSELWNGVLNIGETNRSGNFTTTREFNSFHSNLAWYWYAEIDDYRTPVITTGSNRSAGRVLSETSYDTGTLVSDRGTVYLIYRDQKIGLASGAVFEQLGFRWSAIINGDTSSIPLIYVVTNGVYSHPWGSWVKSGDDIYFVHENGLIPVTTDSIFRDNGGTNKLLVPMNSYDKKLRKLSKMTNDDSRLK